jgi:hypothetical protein
MLMSFPDTVVCKPTPWFTLRAVAMLVMFSAFAGYFAYDGAIGYRKKNKEFYLYETFKQANEEFTRKNAEGGLTPESWSAFAATRDVSFPEDRSILPKDLALPMKWPEVLHDYDKMKPLNYHLLWKEYSGAHGYAIKPGEKAYDAGKIREQWICAVICLVLAVVALFFLARTLRRSISADLLAITTQEGKRVPYSDLKVLDLRKWYTKGLAFADYEGESGKGRIRIDGMTYGGFKEENGQPGEQLIQKIRSNFSGELIEYAAVAEPEEPKTDAANE